MVRRCEHKHLAASDNCPSNHAHHLQASRRMRNIHLVAAWNKWRDLIYEKREKEARTNKCVGRNDGSRLKKEHDKQHGS